MVILATIFFILWIPVVLQDTALWINAWQKRDYRYDRLKAYIGLRSSKRLLFEKRHAIIIVLFLASIIPATELVAPVTITSLLAYGYFVFLTGQKLQEGELVLPAFTFRSTLALSLVVLSYGAATWGVFIYFNEYFITWLLLGGLVVPAVSSVVILSTNPIFYLIGRSIIKRATKKRAKMENLLVVALTGSYGKSSVAGVLEEMLKKDFNVLKTPPHLNTDIGLARFMLKNLNNKHEILVAEIEAKRMGEVRRASELLSPHIGVLTGLTSKHTALLGNMRNVQEAHYELIKFLPEKGLAIFNGDDEYTRALFKHCKRAKRLYASDPLVETTPQRVLFEDIKTVPDGFELQIREKGDSARTLRTSLAGSHTTTNIMGAITVARELGISISDIREALGEVQSIKKTLEIRRGIKETIIIDDSSPGNVNGAISALDLLKRTKGRQKICILQPLEDLGASAERIHKQLAAYIAETCDYCIVTSIDNFSVMYNEAMENGMRKNSFVCLPNTKKALRKAQELCDKGDVILLENNIPEGIRKGLLLNKKDTSPAVTDAEIIV